MRISNINGKVHFEKPPVDLNVEAANSYEYHTISNSATEPTLDCRNGGKLTNSGGPVDEIIKFEGFVSVRTRIW